MAPTRMRPPFTIQAKKQNHMLLKRPNSCKRKYNEETGLSLGLVRLEDCVAEFINNDGIAKVLEF